MQPPQKLPHAVVAVCCCVVFAVVVVFVVLLFLFLCEELSVFAHTSPNTHMHQTKDALAGFKNQNITKPTTNGVTNYKLTNQRAKAVPAASCICTILNS